MSLPFTSFFSDELNFEKERVTPKEGKATIFPFTSFFSSKARAAQGGAAHIEGGEGHVRRRPCRCS